MCGIFGGIGANVNSGIIRALALINRERGEESLGFFDNTGKIIKAASDPIRCLAWANFSTYIDRACSKGWFLAGHTRYSTRGAVSDKNAHPFRYGNIVGAHNGIVDAPKQYAVDSEYLFDSLHRASGDYQKALADVSGYWGLAWFDGAAFWLQTHNQDIAIARKDGAWYYSSDEKHLAAAIGFCDIFRELKEGETLRWQMNSPDPESMPLFRSEARNYWDRRATATQGAIVPAASTGGKSGKKAKKSKEAHKWEAADFDEMIGSAEREYGDNLAQCAGYADFYDFMQKEGIYSPDRALSMLEDCHWIENETNGADADYVEYFDDDGKPRIGYHV